MRVGNSTYTSTGSINSTIPASDVSENITYLDGLGRPIQSVARRANPNMKDVIAFKTYDAFGRDLNNFLPFSTSQNNGNYDPNFLQSVTSYYQSEPNIAHDNAPLSPVLYDNTPFSRILKTGHPGADGQLSSNTLVTYIYTFNNSSNPLYTAVKWDFTIANNSCTRGSAYTAGELTVNEVADEDGARTVKFTDKMGKLILKRSVLDENTHTYANTYYVYDELNQLRYIITPEAETRLTGSFNPDNSVIKDYAFYYTYDKKGRLSTRQTPGRAIEYFVYDKLNRLFLYQNGNLRGLSKWLYNKYDALGRTIITGIGACGAGLSLADLQTSVDNLPYVNEFMSFDERTVNIGYTNNVMPELETNGEIQTVNYFDTYHVLYKSGTTWYFNYVYGFDPNLLFADPSTTSLKYNADTVNVTGKATCTRTMLNENGTLKWLISVYYYDFYGRLIQIREKNQRLGYDITSMHYNGLTSIVDYSKHTQTATLGSNNYAHTEESTSVFDHAGRLTQNRYKINYSPAERTLDLSYNTLGQLMQKNIKNSTYLLQSVDYKYNIRGLLQAINDAALSDGENDLFGMEIYYDQPEGQLMNIPRHNGNISAIKWQNSGGGIKGYTYEYDNFGRLKAGNYAEKGSAWSFNDKYSEKSITYDLNGNIKTLVRKGLKSPNNALGSIDDLSYYYKGNQLIGVNDAVTNNNVGDFYDNGFSAIPDPNVPTTWEYKYDDNGNLISDKNKGIVSISYNYRNQPVSIDMGGGKRITYLYDGAGRRLQKVDYLNATPVTTTNYISNFVYNNNIVAYAQIGEGRIVFNSMTTIYNESDITDNLGNVRATFRINASGQAQLLQTFDYYPFGLRVKGGTDITYPNEYMYQGKELDNENGLNWYNFHARMYDPILGRWHTPDPAQQYVSPYMAMGNDPVNRVDPNGMEDNGNFWRQLGETYREISRQHQHDFAAQYPAYNTGNIDWSSNYFASEFWCSASNGTGGPSIGGGGGSRAKFFAYGTNILGSSDGGAILSDDFHARKGVSFYNEGDQIVKNGGEWGYWKMTTSKVEFANSDIQSEFPGRWISGINGLTWEFQTINPTNQVDKFSNCYYMNNEETICMLADFPSISGSWPALGFGGYSLAKDVTYKRLPIVGVILTECAVSEKIVRDQASDVIKNYAKSGNTDGVYYNFTKYPTPLYNPSVTIGGSMSFYTTSGDLLGTVKSVSYTHLTLPTN
jgi:RHS repeat-associated protein